MTAHGLFTASSLRPHCGKGEEGRGREGSGDIPSLVTNRSTSRLALSQHETLQPTSVTTVQKQAM